LGKDEEPGNRSSPTSVCLFFPRRTQSLQAAPQLNAAGIRGAAHLIYEVITAKAELTAQFIANSGASKSAIVEPTNAPTKAPIINPNILRI
jgi:hypothetical protein